MLPDYFAPGLDLVIVGTAVGERSAARGHYYSGRGNDFWTLLHESGLTARLLRPDDDASLPGLGIGLTDMVKTVAQSHDRGLVYDVPTFIDKVQRFKPRWIAFHGKEAAKAFARSSGQRPPDLGVAPFTVAGQPVFVLPSASAANRRASYDGRSSRLDWWIELAQLLKDAR